MASLVDDDGSAYLGRAEYPEDGLEPRFTQFPVAMDTTATSRNVVAFQGTHVIATFDTSSGPYLAQLPSLLPRRRAPTDTAAPQTPASPPLTRLDSAWHRRTRRSVRLQGRHASKPSFLFGRDLPVAGGLSPCQ